VYFLYIFVVEFIFTGSPFPVAVCVCFYASSETKNSPYHC